MGDLSATPAGAGLSQARKLIRPAAIPETVTSVRNDRHLHLIDTRLESIHRERRTGPVRSSLPIVPIQPANPAAPA
jgi:hypothetical protein